MEKSFIALNDTILKNYQKVYPNLVNFRYDIESDSLIYDGKTVSLNGYGLSRIDPIFFSLNPEDIFKFFANGFYYNSKDSEQVEDLFGQLVITEEEINFLKKFAEKYKERCNIYARNKDLIDSLYDTNDSIKDFAKELLKEKKVVDLASLNGSKDNHTAYGILDSFIRSDNIVSNTNEMEKGFSLTRNKPGFEGFDEDTYFNEKQLNDKLGIAGFTSIILIVGTVLAVGVVLGIVLLG